MSHSQTVIVGKSLGRMRRAIFTCTLAIGIGLMGNMLAWSFITFTDIRWEQPNETEAAPLIVSDVIPQQEEEALDPAQAIRAAASTQNPDKVVQALSVEETPAEETMELSLHDATLGNLVSLGVGVGTIGIIALLPLVMLSTLLGITSGVAGSERLIGVFNLSIILALMVLPLGDILSLPWREGVLSGYSSMTAGVDAYRDGPTTAIGPFVFFTRFLILPLTALVGLMLMYLRFSASVDQAVLQGDTMRVDPEIEVEASSVNMSGRNSRTASALDRIAAESEAKYKKVAPEMPLASQVSAGERPKRVI